MQRLAAPALDHGSRDIQLQEPTAFEVDEWRSPTYVRDLVHACNKACALQVGLGAGWLVVSPGATHSPPHTTEPSSRPCRLAL